MWANKTAQKRNLQKLCVKLKYQSMNQWPSIRKLVDIGMCVSDNGKRTIYLNFGKQRGKLKVIKEPYLFIGILLWRHAIVLWWAGNTTGMRSWRFDRGRSGKVIRSEIFFRKILYRLTNKETTSMVLRSIFF